jgi:hypothetical protein
LRKALTVIAAVIRASLFLDLLDEPRPEHRDFSHLRAFLEVRSLIS